MTVAGIILAIEIVELASNRVAMHEMRRHVAEHIQGEEPASIIAMSIIQIESNLRELLLKITLSSEMEDEQEIARTITLVRDRLTATQQALQRWIKGAQAEIQVTSGDEKKAEEEELALLLTIEEENGRFRQLCEQFLAHVESGKTTNAAAAIALWEGRIEPLSRQLNDDVDRLNESEALVMRNVANGILARISQALWVNAATIVIGLLTAVLVSLFLAKKLVNPILQFKTTLQTIQAQKKYERVELSSQDEIGDLAETFNQLTQQLQLSQSQVIQSSKLASVGELAAGIAHELNQPLMVMRSKNQLLHRRLQKETLTPEQIAEAIEMVDRNTKRMMNIINHLRTFSRQADQAQEVVQINQVIDDCFLLIGEQLRLRDIQIKKEFDPGLPRIKADGNRLEQVFLNLLGNARDAVVEKREKSVDKEKYQAEIAIHTAMSEDRSHIVILISDNGCGIPPGLSQTLFDPFVTSKEVGKGTGLGLSISYGIIQEHKGQIRVAESGPEGTTFCVELPVG